MESPGIGASFATDGFGVMEPQITRRRMAILDPKLTWQLVEMD